MNRLWLLTGLFLFVGCVKITDQSQTEESQPKEISVLDDRAPYLITPLSTPLFYEVRLLMSGTSEVVERISVADQSRLFLPLKIEDGYLIDSTARSNQRYIYRLGRVEGGQYHLEKEISLQIPKDLVVQKEIALSQDESWSKLARVFLLPGGLITTNGFYFKLETQKLYALGGVIRTFASPEGPSVGNRKNGGRIEITAEEGQGLFRIQLIGKNGQKGIRPPHLLDGVDGENGGDSGQATLKIQNASLLRFESQLKPGIGGPGGEPGITVSHGGGWIPIINMGRPGNPGKNGKKEFFCTDNAGVRSCN